MIRNAKIIPTISILMIIGFLVTSLTSYFVSRASLRSQISQNELPITSDNIYSEIQRDLLRPIFISSLMASDTFLWDWVITGEQNVSQITRYLNEIKVRYGTITSFFVSEKTKIYFHSNGILKKISKTEDRDIWYFRVRDMDAEFSHGVGPECMKKHYPEVCKNGIIPKEKPSTP